jgi:hypothetical protein
MLHRITPMREIKLQDLKSKTPAELVSFVEENGVENASTMRKQEWCSPPRIGRQTIFPAHSTPRGTGASLFNDK